MNSLKNSLKADQEHYRIVHLVNTVYHLLLREYIAPANEREVLENLYKFYTDSEITLISKADLKMYKELERLNLEVSILKVNN